jgi:pyrroline-5-carboxylate reductase
MKQSIGFIGGGRVTRILLQAFRNKNAQFSKIVVTEPNPDVSANLKKSFPDIQIDNASVAASQDLVFLSLHPPVVMDALESIKSNVNSNTILISLAPKITLGKISSKLTHVKNIARLIPNATSFINEGYNPVCFSSDFSRSEKRQVLDLLKLMGNTFEVSEEKLESYAIMSAMLPTYFWFQWKELVEIGQKIGLSEKESTDSVNDTIIASLNLMFKSGMTPENVMDLIPVKPIAEHEDQIRDCFKSKLLPLFEKIKPS